MRKQRRGDVNINEDLIGPLARPQTRLIGGREFAVS